MQDSIIADFMAPCGELETLGLDPVHDLDGNTATHRALRLLGAEDCNWKGVVVRGRLYFNNIFEQDHRAIKRRCAPMLGLKTFRTAAVTLAGVELAHRIHNQQFAVGRRCGIPASLKQLWETALA